ncbi:PKHG3 protein, partial [Atlantisia rogersi]|nr:PKHG3 protein [Atlantisia rogersi]
MEEPDGGGAEPWSELLHNSNNNASPGPWARSGHPLAPFSSAGTKPSYLGRVVLEIVESERTYARDLRSIVEGYLGKIIDAEEPVLRPEQVSVLFGNIEDIYELSSTLLQNLESCASDPVAVAVCFVTRSQEFAIYTQYCNNYPSSVAALAECMKSKPQARFLRECQERLRHSLPLGAYLLKPVQRILKYHLLLQEIAKHFEHKSGDDYEVVLEAIDTMTCVAWYINDMKRKHEHAIRQQEIQSLLLGWKGPDLTSYGELVLEGTFRVQRVRHERAVFLFDKTLLITKRRGDHYIYKSHIPVGTGDPGLGQGGQGGQVGADSISPQCSSLMLIESTRDSLCFSLAHYKHGKQQHSLQAKSVEEKRVWTHHIKRLILENHHAIVPQKAKEAILEMDLFYPPRLPRYSPERLKKSWSCQPLGDTELRQGRRQSGESHVCQTSLGWWRRKKRRRRRRRRKKKRRLWARTARSSCWGLGTCCWSPRGSRYLPPPPKLQGGCPHHSQGTLYQSHGTPHPSQGTLYHSWGSPYCSSGCCQGEQEHAAEDAQGLSSEEEEEEEEGAASSILPPSVLDQASVIAERFGGG